MFGFADDQWRWMEWDGSVWKSGDLMGILHEFSLTFMASDIWGKMTMKQQNLGEPPFADPWGATMFPMSEWSFILVFKIARESVWKWPIYRYLMIFIYDFHSCVQLPKGKTIQFCLACPVAHSPTRIPLPGRIPLPRPHTNEDSS